MTTFQTTTNQSLTNQGHPQTVDPASIQDPWLQSIQVSSHDEINIQAESFGPGSSIPVVDITELGHMVVGPRGPALLIPLHLAHLHPLVNEDYREVRLPELDIAHLQHFRLGFLSSALLSPSIETPQLQHVTAATPDTLDPSSATSLTHVQHSEQPEQSSELPSFVEPSQTTSPPAQVKTLESYSYRSSYTRMKATASGVRFRCPDANCSQTPRTRPAPIKKHIKNEHPDDAKSSDFKPIKFIMQLPRNQATQGVRRTSKKSSKKSNKKESAASSKKPRNRKAKRSIKAELF